MTAPAGRGESWEGISGGEPGAAGRAGPVCRVSPLPPSLTPRGAIPTTAPA